MDIVNKAAQNTSQTVQKFLKTLFYPCSQRHLLLFLVCQGIQKYIRMDLLMTERLRSWLHISDPKIVLSIPNTLIKAAALWSHVCVFSIATMPRSQITSRQNFTFSRTKHCLSLTWMCLCVCVCVCGVWCVCVCVCLVFITLWGPNVPMRKQAYNHTEWSVLKIWNSRKFPVRCRFRCRVGVGR